MKKCLTVVLLICLVFVDGAAKAEVHGFFELQTMSPEVIHQATFDGGLVVPFKSGLGLRAFLLVKPGFAQAHIGPTWQPIPWLKIGASVGGRQALDGMDLQTAYLLWLGYDWFSFCGMVEVGEKAYQGDDSHIWYDLTARFKVTDWITFGMKDRRPAGFGPLVELTWPAAHLTGWVAWVPVGAEDPEFVPERFLLGAKLGF